MSKAKENINKTREAVALNRENGARARSANSAFDFITNLPAWDLWPGSPPGFFIYLRIHAADRARANGRQSPGAKLAGHSNATTPGCHRGRCRKDPAMPGPRANQRIFVRMPASLCS